jgi:hypothetical protein
MNEYLIRLLNSNTGRVNFVTKVYCNFISEARVKALDLIASPKNFGRIKSDKIEVTGPGIFFEETVRPEKELEEVA